MWRILIVLFLLIVPVWWFFFRETTQDTSMNTDTVILEDLSRLEYKKYVRQAQARNLGIKAVSEVSVNEGVQEKKDKNTVSIYKIDANGKLVEDIQVSPVQEKSKNPPSPELLSFSGDFPTALEWEFSVKSSSVSQSIAGIRVPNLSLPSSWGSGGGLIFDPPLVLDDPKPASGNMKFGTWRGEL